MPPRLDAALQRALDKSPDRRYATAGEFIASLVSGSHRVRVIGRRVAVIPFVHACARPLVDTRSDTVGEEIAFALRDFEGIVIAPNVSGGCDVPSGHMVDMARRAGADVVLLGDVRRADDNAGVLVSAMLFDGRTVRRIWSGASAGTQPDHLASTIGPAREIARAVAAALGARRLSDRVACAAPTATSFAAPTASRTGTDERPVVH
jgi:TolB-like protein